VFIQPCGDIFGGVFALGDLEQESMGLMFIPCGRDAVRFEKETGGFFGSALVAIHKKMMGGDAVHEGGGFINQRGELGYAKERNKGATYRRTQEMVITHEHQASNDTFIEVIEVVNRDDDIRVIDIGIVVVLVIVNVIVTGRRYACRC
jgi:hypothetical protein